MSPIVRTFCLLDLNTQKVCFRHFFLSPEFASRSCDLLSKWSNVVLCVGDSDESVDKTYFVFLPPELCLVHPLSGSLVRGAQRLPSIMRRVESMLLAIQLKHIIDHPVPASKVLYWLKS